MLDCGENGSCQKAATRAYCELRTSGVLDKDAFNAAVRVFRYHHPKTPHREAKFVVADWLAPETLEVFQ